MPRAFFYVSLIVAIIISCVYSQYNKQYTYNENTELHSFSMMRNSDYLNCDDESTLLEQMERAYEQRVGYKGSSRFDPCKFGSRLDKKTVQSEMLNILIHFHKACEKMNVKMFISHGTLLGAYRHQGFIPWDDDIDTTIFEEYVDVIRSEEFNSLLPRHIRVQKGRLTCESEFYKRACALKGYEYSNDGFSVCKNLNSGIYIDIFHMNHIPQHGRDFYDVINGLITTSEKDDMLPFQKIEFEGHLFNAPNNTKKNLCLMYNRSIDLEGRTDENNVLHLNKNRNNGFDLPSLNLRPGDLYTDDELNVCTHS